MERGIAQCWGLPLVQRLPQEGGEIFESLFRSETDAKLSRQRHKITLNRYSLAIQCAFVVVMLPLLVRDSHAADVVTNSSSREGVGYVWLKKDVLIPVPKETTFCRLRNGELYQIIGQIDAGYLMLVETTDSDKRPALIPFRDRMGNSTERGNYAGIENAQPGYFPLKKGQKYPVLVQKQGLYSILWSSGGCTQTVEIAETDVTFVSVSDYENAASRAFNRLKIESEDLLKAGQYHRALDTVTRYVGEYAAETRSNREKLATELTEKYNAAQKAKGLVQYRGEWVTNDEASHRAEADRKRQAEAARQYEEEQRRLQSIPLPFVVADDFDVAFPGAEYRSSVFYFKKGNRFALLPDGGPDKIKYRLVLLGTQFHVRRFYDLPQLAGKVQLDTGGLMKLKAAPLRWKVEIVESARAASVKRLAVLATRDSRTESDLQTPSLCFLVQRGGASDGEVHLLSYTQFDETGIVVFANTIRSETVAETAKCYGMFLADGVGHVTSMAFPPDSAFPQKTELQIAANAYQQFENSQNLLRGQIKSLNEQVMTAERQESRLASAISTAQSRANAAAAKTRSNDLGRAIVGRTEYEAAMSEIRTLQAQRDGVRQTISDLKRQVQQLEQQVITLEYDH